MKRILAPLIQVILFLLVCEPVTAQQQPDTLFQFQFSDQTYSEENAPVIYIDESHNNLHTLSSGFAPFAKLASHDGYKMGRYTANSDLNDIDYLVIANAINSKNQGNWQRPIYPAFEEEEIERIKSWVKDGGRLLLIADHMPFAGAANDLAKAFGFEFCDGFAQLSEKEKGRDAFTIQNNRLLQNSFTDGSLGTQVDKVISFAGSSFSIPEKAIGIMKFMESDWCLKPEVAWQFDENTEQVNLTDHYQGAVMNFGEGKIAVFGEAALFTAQTIKQNGTTFKVGFNTPVASQNISFIRNVLHWLTSDFIAKSAPTLEDEILAVNREMEQVFNAKKYANVAKFYTEDAVMIGSKVEVIGYENILPYWEMFSGDLKWEIENIEVKALGKGFALQRGYSNVYYTKADGTQGNSRSLFSLIWKKTDDGWRMMLDHFSGR